MSWTIEQLNKVVILLHEKSPSNCKNVNIQMTNIFFNRAKSLK